MSRSSVPIAEGRQAARSRRSTAKMLDAAAEIVVDLGYMKLTLAAVGERAGFSRGLAAARFGSKEALVHALVDRLATRWNERKVIPQSAGRSGLDRVVGLLEAIQKQAAEDPHHIEALYRLMFEAVEPEFGLVDEFKDFHVGMRADIVQMLEAGVADGSVAASIDPNSAAMLIVGTLRGLGYQWLIQRDDFPFVEALGELVTSTRGHFAARSGENLGECTVGRDNLNRR